MVWSRMGFAKTGLLAGGVDLYSQSLGILLAVPFAVMLFSIRPSTLRRREKINQKTLTTRQDEQPRRVVASSSRPVRPCNGTSCPVKPSFTFSISLDA
jgi:hypothetical protein